MTPQEFEVLIHRAESDTLDFKETAYDFTGETHDVVFRKRGLFAKDILCMHNTPRNEPAYIVLGVKCFPDGQKGLTGIARHVDDAFLQEQIASLVTPHPKFRYIPMPYQGKSFGVIEIPVERNVGPCLPVKDIVGAGLRSRVVYLRRNSRNSDADHAEAKNAYKWFTDSPSPKLQHNHPKEEPDEIHPEVIVLIPGYAVWEQAGTQRASGTITLIKGTKNVIVDTGVPTQKGEIVAKLQANGLKPSNIHYVVITHGQSDHCGNNNLFPKAEFILDTDISVGDKYWVHHFHKDDYHIARGISVISTPGHTDHDISVVVETRDGTVVIAGDIFERDGDWQDGAWEAWTRSKTAQRRSREKILHIADFIVPGHGDIFRSPSFAALEIAPASKEPAEAEVFLRKHAALINDLARRFQTHWSRIDEEKIKEFLRQFGDYRSLQSIFPLLQHIDYIDDAKITDIFDEFYRSLVNGNNTRQPVFCRLGGGKDSSSLIGYLCSKVFDEKRRREIPFENIEAAARTFDPKNTMLVFLDDNIGSGKQAIRIFSEWLGLANEKPEHVHRLTREAEAWLRETEIRYFPLIGFREGKESLTAFLREQGISIFVQPALSMDESVGCFDAKGLIFEQSQFRLHAKRIAEEIGFQLFSDRADWAEEKRRSMALGYRGAQKLIVFSYNTPNCTLPILWKKGVYNGVEWLPLFPRRD